MSVLIFRPVRDVCRHRLTMVLSTTLVALAVSLAARPLAAETVLTASTWVAPSHPISESMGEWGREVEAATAGRVRVRMLAKAVAPPPATFDAVRDGLADVSFTLHGYTPGRFPLTTLAEWPMLGDSAETMSVAWQRIHQRHLLRANEHQGVKVLAVFTHGPGMILSKSRAVANAGDLRGLKLRVPGGIGMELGKALGADVTFRPASEAYQLLATGVMDGALFPAEAIPLFRLDKLIGHVTEVPGGLFNSSFVMLMNLDRWRELSAIDQAAIDRVSGEHLARAIGRATDRRTREAMETIAAEGVKVTAAGPTLVADIRSRSAEFERQWLVAARARGIEDPAAVVAEFRGELARPPIRP